MNHNPQTVPKPEVRRGVITLCIHIDPATHKIGTPWDLQPGAVVLADVHVCQSCSRAYASYAKATACSEHICIGGTK
jgi:hypothetical protein